MRKRWQRSDGLLNTLMEPMLLADLAGQLMVHTYEAETPAAREAAVFALAVGDAQGQGAFLQQGWQEALEEFRERGLISDDELAPLLRGTAERATEARRALLETVQERVYELLEQAIDEGRTQQEFAAQLRADAEGLGISADDPAYLNTVFRTNVMDAYGRGRHRALESPAVVEAFPYRQISTAGDARVRSEHDDLDGLVYAADGPLRSLKTPFGYNCRCAIRVAPADYDGPVVDELPAGSVAPGFG